MPVLPAEHLQADEIPPRQQEAAILACLNRPEPLGPFPRGLYGDGGHVHPIAPCAGLQQSRFHLSQGPSPNSGQATDGASDGAHLSQSAQRALLGGQSSSGAAKRHRCTGSTADSASAGVDNVTQVVFGGVSRGCIPVQSNAGIGGSGSGDSRSSPGKRKAKAAQCLMSFPSAKAAHRQIEENDKAQSAQGTEDDRSDDTDGSDGSDVAESHPHDESAVRADTSPGQAE